jgi:broad specificity phosphatase PhoE
MTSTKYTVEQRAEAAALMVCHGNSLTVADMTNIPASTLRHWHQNDQQFQELMREVWVEHGARIQGQLGEIIQKAHAKRLTTRR